MKVKYIHFRHQYPDTIKDGVLTVGGFKPHGGMTIAYYEEDGHVSGFAVARCHSKDRYQKSLGRIIATGRLHSYEYYTQVNMAEQDFFKKAQALWNEIKNTPLEKAGDPLKPLPLLVGEHHECE